MASAECGPIHPLGTRLNQGQKVKVGVDSINACSGGLAAQVGIGLVQRSAAAGRYSVCINRTW